MSVYKIRYSILFRTIAIAVVCAFLVNDVAFAIGPKDPAATSALAPTSPFSPIVSDEKTKPKEIEAFRDEVALKELDDLIHQFVNELRELRNAGLSDRALDRHLEELKEKIEDQFPYAAKKFGKFRFNEMYWEGDTLCLPVEDDNENIIETRLYPIPKDASQENSSPVSQLASLPVPESPQPDKPNQVRNEGLEAPDAQSTPQDASISSRAAEDEDLELWGLLKRMRESLEDAKHAYNRKKFWETWDLLRRAKEYNRIRDGKLPRRNSKAFEENLRILDSTYSKLWHSSVMLMVKYAVPRMMAGFSLCLFAYCMVPEWRNALRSDWVPVSVTAGLMGAEFLIKLWWSKRKPPSGGSGGGIIGGPFMLAIPAYFAYQELRTLFIFNEFIPRHFNILKDFVKETFGNVLALVKRDDSASSIGMSEVNMASALPDGNKTKALNGSDDDRGFEGSEPHLSISTSWSPTNLSLGTSFSTSRQSSITSLILLSSVGMVLACVWQPFSDTAVAINIPSSSCSITIGNSYLCITLLLLSLYIIKYTPLSIFSQGRMRSFIKGGIDYFTKAPALPEGEEKYDAQELWDAYRDATLSVENICVQYSFGLITAEYKRRREENEDAATVWYYRQVFGILSAIRNLQEIIFKFEGVIPEDELIGLIEYNERIVNRFLNRDFMVMLNRRDQIMDHLRLQSYNEADIDDIEEQGVDLSGHYNTIKGRMWALKRRLENRRAINGLPIDDDIRSGGAVGGSSLISLGGRRAWSEFGVLRKVWPVLFRMLGFFATSDGGSGNELSHKRDRTPSCGVFLNTDPQVREKFIPVTDKTMKRLQPYIKPVLLWSREKGLTITDEVKKYAGYNDLFRQGLEKYLDYYREMIISNIQRLEKELGHPRKLGIDVNLQEGGSSGGMRHGRQRWNNRRGTLSLFGEPKKPEEPAKISAEKALGSIEKCIRDGRPAEEAADLAKRQIDAGIFSIDDLVSSFAKLVHEKPHYLDTCRAIARILGEGPSEKASDKAEAVSEAEPQSQPPQPGPSPVLAAPRLLKPIEADDARIWSSYSLKQMPYYRLLNDLYEELDQILWPDRSKAIQSRLVRIFSRLSKLEAELQADREMYDEFCWHLAAQIKIKGWQWRVTSIINGKSKQASANASRFVNSFPEESIPSMYIQRMQDIRAGKYPIPRHIEFRLIRDILGVTNTEFAEMMGVAGTNPKAVTQMIYGLRNIADDKFELARNHCLIEMPGRLKSIRERLNLSHKELATRLSGELPVSPSDLMDMESGKNNISYDVMVRLLDLEDELKKHEKKPQRVSRETSLSPKQERSGNTLSTSEMIPKLITQWNNENRSGTIEEFSEFAGLDAAEVRRRMDNNGLIHTRLSAALLPKIYTANVATLTPEETESIRDAMSKQQINIEDWGVIFRILVPRVPQPLPITPGKLSKVAEALGINGLSRNKIAAALGRYYFYERSILEGLRARAQEPGQEQEVSPVDTQNEKPPAIIQEALRGTINPAPDELSGVLRMTGDSKNPDQDNENQSANEENKQTIHNQSPSLLSSVATTNEAMKTSNPTTNTTARNDAPGKNSPSTNAANTSLPISYNPLDSSKRCVLPNLTIDKSLPRDTAPVKEIGPAEVPQLKGPCARAQEPGQEQEASLNHSAPDGASGSGQAPAPAVQYRKPQEPKPDDPLRGGAEGHKYKDEQKPPTAKLPVDELSLPLTDRSVTRQAKTDAKFSYLRSSPAGCLITIKNDYAMLASMIPDTNGKCEGVYYKDLASKRFKDGDGDRFSEATVEMELVYLRKIGILISVEGKRGYLRFSDMMIGPNRSVEETKTRIDLATNAVIDKKKTGEDRPLYWSAISDDFIETVRVAVSNAVNGLTAVEIYGDARKTVMGYDTSEAIAEASQFLSGENGKRWMSYFKTVSAKYARSARQQDPMAYFSAAFLAFATEMQILSPSDPKFEKSVKHRIRQRIISMTRIEKDRKPSPEMYGDINKARNKLLRATVVKDNPILPSANRRRPIAFSEMEKEFGAEVENVLMGKDDEDARRMADARHMLIRMIYSERAKLTKRERYILMRHHLDGDTPRLEDIAHELGLRAKSGISMTYTKAIAKLRAAFGDSFAAIESGRERIGVSPGAVSGTGSSSETEPSLDVNRERDVATDFTDAVFTHADKLMKTGRWETAKKESENLIIAIEVHGYVPDGQKGPMQSVTEAVKDFAERLERHTGLKNVRVAIGNSKTLLGEIKAKQGELNDPDANIVALGSEATLSQEEFRKLNAFLAYIDGDNFDVTLFIKMIKIALDLASGKTGVTSSDIGIISIGDRIVRMTPIRPCDVDGAAKAIRIQVDEIGTKA